MNFHLILHFRQEAEAAAILKKQMEEKKAEEQRVSEVILPGCEVTLHMYLCLGVNLHHVCLYMSEWENSAG